MGRSRHFGAGDEPFRPSQTNKIWERLLTQYDGTDDAPSTTTDGIDVSNATHVLYSLAPRVPAYDSANNPAGWQALVRVWRYKTESMGAEQPSGQWYPSEELEVNLDGNPAASGPAEHVLATLNSERMWFQIYSILGSPDAYSLIALLTRLSLRTDQDYCCPAGAVTNTSIGSGGAGGGDGVLALAEDEWIRSTERNDVVATYASATTFDLTDPETGAALDINASQIVAIGRRAPNAALDEVDLAIRGQNLGCSIAGNTVTIGSPTPFTFNAADEILFWYEERREPAQESLEIQRCEDSTEWAVLGDDTANLADTTNHVFGTGAIEFDKVDGTDDTVFAGVDDTIDAVDISLLVRGGGYVGLCAYLADLTDVDYVFLRLGTDNSNYNEWRWNDSSLTAGEWMHLRMPTALPSYAGNTGDGWDPSAITYVAIGVAFDDEADTLADIRMDHVHILGGHVTQADIDGMIGSGVAIPGTNLARVGNEDTTVNNGAADDGTQRVSIANDCSTANDLSGILTAVQLLDDVNGEYIPEEVISPTNVSDRTAAACDAETMYSFIATEDCWGTWGDNAVNAVAESGYFIPAGIEIKMRSPSSDTYFAAIRDTVDGKLSINKIG